MTGPRSVGGCTNCTPFATRRSYSACTSSTAKEVLGIPSSTSALHERTDRGMGIRLKQKLRPLRVFRGYHGDPGVFAQGNVVLELEAKRFGVKAKRLLLVVHEDAGEVDSHRSHVPFICCDRPTLGNGLQRVALEPMELRPALAPGADQPGGLQDAQVLGDRLPRGVDAVLHGQACADFEERLT